MGSVESLTNVKKIVENINEPVVVVVSALGGITDRLIRTSQLAVAGDDNYRNEFDAMVDRHHGIIDAVIPAGAAHDALKDYIDTTGSLDNDEKQ